MKESYTTDTSKKCDGVKWIHSYVDYLYLASLAGDVSAHDRLIKLIEFLKANH